MSMTLILPYIFLNTNKSHKTNMQYNKRDNNTAAKK